ncbi:MAG: phosphate ABC transporter permease PstA [Proteobacteria bacterium]|nr:phosphate ABC transporter permease PstA [Pseudomonadota bacterium]
MNKQARTVHPALHTQAVVARLRKRHRRERRFRAYCIAAVGFAVLCLIFLFVDIISKGYTAFQQTAIRFEIFFDPEIIDPDGERDAEMLAEADYAALWRQPLLRAHGEVNTRALRRELYRLVSSGAAFQLQRMVANDPDLIGHKRTVWLLASDEVDMVVKGHVSRHLPEAERPVSDRQLAWLDNLAAQGLVEQQLNRRFFTNGDSREPEEAGILAALMGSVYTMVVTLMLSFPLGVATAVYLEEFAPTNRWIDLIEVNINNLAAVPSIVFGLLGLAVFLNFFDLPRSAPLVGGLVLTLMTLPTIIIASRAALKAVPPSIREAAYGLGATPMQVIQHHVLPAAMPGILTGTIIGLAQALGETAPLLMIGMVAFIVDVPQGFTDPATALPVQIFLWADSPERAFVEKTSAAIMVLLVFLIAMNALAVYLRRRWEQRW